MPVSLPVAALFSKTMVAGPAVAVVGVDLYAVMLLSAVQVSTWSAWAVSRMGACAPAWADDRKSAGSATASRTTARPGAVAAALNVLRKAWIRRTCMGSMHLSKSARGWVGRRAGSAPHPAPGRWTGLEF